MTAADIKIILKNKKAYFNYEILEKLEAGLVLAGSEVKSIRDGKASINEAYARPSGGQMYIYNMDVSHYKSAPVEGYQPKRLRKLLLHKREISRLIGRVQEKGLTLIPLMLYFKNGLAKLELGLARGKKLYDKRESIKRKDVEREMKRVMGK